ncbi:MAG: class I SAM-dependent methyltransferase [Thermoplasmata archaeon]|nr:MAG: class I SAM-dependent methyltransferase [Thermoplasmata archaeon]
MEKQIIKKISDYNEIFSLIWKELKIKGGQNALDIGVGTRAISSKEMLNKKLKVVGVDINPDCQVHSKLLGIPVHICDASFLPFKDDSYDFSLAFFSMHEIDPKKHIDVLKEMKRVSKKMVIVEPLPNTNEIGKLYDKIWQEAMNSVGKFEIYQTMDYWSTLVSRLAPKKKLQYRLKIKKSVTKANADEFCEQGIEHFKKNRVEKKYIDEMKNLTKKIKKSGMEHTDMIVIIGFFD